MVNEREACLPWQSFQVLILPFFFFFLMTIPRRFLLLSWIPDYFTFALCVSSPFGIYLKENFTKRWGGEIVS